MASALCSTCRRLPAAERSRWPTRLQPKRIPNHKNLQVVQVRKIIEVATRPRGQSFIFFVHPETKVPKIPPPSRFLINNSICWHLCLSQNINIQIATMMMQSALPRMATLKVGSSSKSVLCRTGLRGFSSEPKQRNFMSSMTAAAPEEDGSHFALILGKPGGGKGTISNKILKVSRRRNVFENVLSSTLLNNSLTLTLLAGFPSISSHQHGRLTA